MQEKVWNSLFESSKDLITNFSSNQDKLLSSVKEFSDNLVNFSEIYFSDREEFFRFLKNKYRGFYLHATSIVSSADSVSLIMQLNEGVNDYLILINLFRQLLVTLDSLTSDYWLKIGEKVKDVKLIKLIIGISNEARFENDGEVPGYVLKTLEKNRIRENDFFKNYMNKELWNEIKLLEEKILNKPDGDFEYFKELLSKSEHLADDMVINLWAILAINISYLEFLNDIVGEI
ncbi:hypothetical protein [Spiroplasma diminutum]|uniref:Uncharacterized protein n=1 Tax=Spiroplasma diminutum CUAS-1 TaxID=1276221 RepID=S5MDT4_9MOLU|nr:hypothetical protein [Spiroplasma diminutum]AGR41878.1 hypothetical protein SDIMI_v3c01740 [Spiroplasma diminutum CUAS-1]